MKESAPSSTPKAINIIRPSNQKIEKQNYPQFISQPSKISRSQIHEKPSTFSLYDPKQNLRQPTPFYIQPLKKPVIELYKPGKYQLKMISSRSQISQKPEQMLNPQPRHEVIEKHKHQEDLSALSDQDESSADDDDTANDDNDQDTTDNTREEQDDQTEETDEFVDDILPEARVNRKIADLEISNKSLLTINEMLETTVRHQAKQVASFKKQMMTLPENEQQEQQHREEIIQQAENEDDWENDEQFNRLKRMTEMLIEQAQTALLFQAQATGGRVIMTGHHHRRSSSSRRQKSTRSSHDKQQQQP